MRERIDHRGIASFRAAGRFDGDATDVGATDVGAAEASATDDRVTVDGGRGDPHGAGGDAHYVDQSFVDARLLDAARHAVVVESRRQQRDLRQRATTLVALRTTLRDLQTRSVPVTITTSWGRKLRGQLADVGDDYAALTLADDVPAALRFGYLAMVVPDPDWPVRVSEGPEGFCDGRRFVELLERWWENESVLAVDGSGFDGPLRGWILALGDDLLSLVREADRSVVHLPISAVGLAWVPVDSSDRGARRGVSAHGGPR